MRRTRVHPTLAGGGRVVAFCIAAAALTACGAPKFPGGSDKDGNISQRSVEKPTAMVTSAEMFNSTPNSQIYPASRSGVSAPPSAAGTAGQTAASSPVTSYPVTAYPLAASPAAVAALGHDDAAFARAAMSISATEIALARIAAVRAQRAEIRDFAARMLADHRNVAAQIDDYALSHGEAVDWAVATEDQAAIARLRNASESGFDRIYLAETISAHERAAALLAARAGGTGEAALVARNTLPGVERHLAEARVLQARL